MILVTPRKILTLEEYDDYDFDSTAERFDTHFLLSLKMAVFFGIREGILF